SAVAGTYNFGPGSITGSTGAAFNVTGGAAVLTYTGSITQTTAAQALVNVAGTHTGTLTFSGALSASNGTGLQFTDADGTYNFNGTTTLAGGDAGIDILNGSAGSFTFGSGTTITNPAGTAFNVDGTTSAVTANITYAGTITQNTAAQRWININTYNTGTISFTGLPSAYTGTTGSTGVNLNAVNGNVTFSNGLTLGSTGARMTATPLTITGGTGTYNFNALNLYTAGVTALIATNADGTINTTSGTVDATGATAINISGPAGITTLGVTLTTVNSTAGANNVFLTNCGGTAALGTGTLSGATGNAFDVTGGNAAVTYAGTITN
ncbi:beta strand repeat-containing protein, partial [Segetibacter aerophilus]|uniref:beta strand repeat-containing protein n=1 Tax=Segetibacter aerophilus TaxID=670293 RepID=UPI003530B3CF